MIVIKVNRRLIKLAGIAILAIAVMSGIFIHLYNVNNSKTVTAYYTGQSISFRLKSFINSDTFYSQGNIIVEVFDVGKGTVVKRLQSTGVIQNEAQKYIEGINGMYPKVNAFPDKGYIVRIPLELPIMTQNQWVKAIVKDLFVIFPVKEKPYLLILDEKSRPVFYTFKGDANILLKSLGLEQGS